MNSHDLNRHSEPLSPEERALRESLARLGPNGEPSSALDARILAAAHAAATTPSHAQRPARRWPVALGIAASLTLAVGIAWQLRPVQEAATYDEAASAAAVQSEAAATQQESAAAAAVAADQARMVEVQPQSASDARAVQAPTGGSRRESDKPRSTPRRAAQVERALAPPPAPPAPPEPEVVFDEPAAADAEIPAPVAAPPATAAPSPAQAAKAISDEARTQAAERNSAAGTAAQAREDAVAEDVPPATADSPEVREAWLQRIRELAEAGDVDDARASLEEFVRRYPNHPLPDDLRPLLE